MIKIIPGQVSFNIVQVSLSKTEHCPRYLLFRIFDDGKETRLLSFTKHSVKGNGKIL